MVWIPEVLVPLEPVDSFVVLLVLVEDTYYPLENGIIRLLIASLSRKRPQVFGELLDRKVIASLVPGDLFFFSTGFLAPVLLLSVVEDAQSVVGLGFLCVLVGLAEGGDDLTKEGKALISIPKVV